MLGCPKSPKRSGFCCCQIHQIPVDESISDLLSVVTQMGTFKYWVLAQGICSSGDLFNFLTDGECKIDPNFKCLKNVDDFMSYIIGTDKKAG